MPSTLFKNCFTFYLAKYTVNISALQHYCFLQLQLLKALMVKPDKCITRLNGSTGVMGIKGDRGDEGSRGSSGPPGIKGVKGEQGSKGEK